MSSRLHSLLGSSAGVTAAVLLCQLVLLMLTLMGSPTPVSGASMLYKKNSANDRYEPDLVAVSSTVIPLLEYQSVAAMLGSGAGGGDGSDAVADKLHNEEYRQAYLKHLNKKYQLQQQLRLNGGKDGNAEGIAAGAQVAGADRLITGELSGVCG